MSSERVVPEEGKSNLPLRDQIISQIPVDYFIERLHVEDPYVQETLRAFPTLCYLLGNVEPAINEKGSQVRDSRPDGVERPIHYLTEGSGMFGLKSPEDAMRWKGIFNHALGTARQVYYLTERLATLTPEQKQQFADRGFDISSFEDLDARLLRDFMMISHGGRRSVDEAKWHGLIDEAHERDENGEIKTSGIATLELLSSYGADSTLLNLMRVETHAELIAESTTGDNILPRVDDNILTYCDWTFAQRPMTLEQRFEEFERTSPLPKEQLEVLRLCGTNFEKALKEILGENIYEEMANSGPYDWETQIRKAYCASSGIKLEEAFPEYVSQFPSVL